MKLVIDIGSNTIKCLLASVAKDSACRGAGVVKKLFEKTLPSRISAGEGKLVGGAERIVAGSVQTLVDAARTAAGCAAFDITAVATSALRDAPERDFVAAFVKARTGVDIQILSEKREAELSFKGAMADSAVEAAVAERPCVFFDLGGGSMEVVFGSKDGVDLAESFRLGAVSITKKFPEIARKPSMGDIERVSEFAKRTFSGKIPHAQSGSVLVGAGGAVVASRMMKKRLGLSGAENLVSLSDMKTMIGLVCAETDFGRSEKFGIDAARADIIPAAFVVIAALMEHLGVSEMIHTFSNLRYGVLLS